MGKKNYLPLLLLCALGRLVRGQLVIPSGLPSTSSNFRLRSHSTAGNTTLGGQIENCILATSGQSDCNQVATLASDDTASQTFFVNVESGVILSAHEGKQRILTLEEAENENKVLKLECGEEAISQLGISFHNSTPILALKRDVDSQFYACRDETGTIGVFYRETHNEPLRSGCADIELVLECTLGPGHGATELAACCARVNNGHCLPK
ncbi:hypothetical protein LMH87_002962 [Akanthomyces muscarius]|uniref:DUF7907 domain-containing protein n=1 Tax=Akanthomyces muscarius TaxID=2231603 RepID=A0A9W8Q9X1_AKAMU|nr:hypothetical protein LMH87_002962 [Akanthomyces muscarius]KAJ4148496.1 hypothetical protein LMH87_002962 [Akanthomyces muscarius]